MALQTIDRGTSANSETGDDARTWAGKTNANFLYLEGLINLKKVKISTYWVDKNGNTDIQNFEVGDRFEGWLDNDTRYVVGKVIALPFDINDNTKTVLIIDNIL